MRKSNLKIRENLKRIIKLNNILVNIILLLIGFLCLIFAHGTQVSNIFISNVLIAFGSTLLIGFLLFLMYLVFSPQKEEDNDYIKTLYSREGLVEIYDKKSGDMNDKINNVYLKESSTVNYDIITFGGLTTLINEAGSLLIDQLKNRRRTRALVIKILTVNPYAPFLFHYVLDEKYDLLDQEQKSISYDVASSASKELRRHILALYEWVKELQDRKARENWSGSIDIQFYTSLPSLRYHRVGNHLFVSSNQIGKISQHVRTFEFIVNSEGFKYYSDYFDHLWKHKSFSMPMPRVMLPPELISGNTNIHRILQRSLTHLDKVIKNDYPNQIKATLTICNCPEEGQRSNIIEVESHTTIRISGSEDVSQHDMNNERQVAGSAICEKAVRFELVNDEEYAHIYAVLAIPIVDNDNSVVAAVTYDFYRGVADRINLPDGITPENVLHNRYSLVECNSIIVEEAKRTSDFLSLYLHIES